MMQSNVEYRQLRSLAEMAEIEHLQEVIWGYGRRGDSPLPYPARCLFEFSESGGHIGGAYDNQSQMIGFSAGWLGRESPNQPLYLHSQLVGVAESYRDKGIGFALKMHQRNYALSVGVSVIKWTFDPLQFRNAFLNLHKLGAQAKTFAPNYFGFLRGTQNKTFATDRLWAIWNLTIQSSERSIREIKSLREAVELLPGVEEPRCSIDLGINEASFTLTIPSIIPTYRKSNPELFQYWQSQLREAMIHYLPRYSVTDALKEPDHFSYILMRS